MAMSILGFLQDESYDAGKLNEPNAIYSCYNFEIRIKTGLSYTRN